MKEADIKTLMVGLEGLKNILETGALYFRGTGGEN